MTETFSDAKKLLNGNELADALGRHRNYITFMRRRGFSMPGGLATIAEARAWLVRNPAPRSRKMFKSGA